ncbi:hypothetical protein HY218_02705 [Candidatus Saccharibacteria bacterium]|nr:hypothetical protein [Candidatus Saccharibacteria bacterium]
MEAAPTVYDRELAPGSFEHEYERMDKLFHPYYSSEYEYHNFDHPRYVAEQMRADIAYCEANGITFNYADRVQLAAFPYTHDAGYHWPVRQPSSFGSLEHRSAVHSGVLLRHEGYDPETIVLPLVEGIMVTQLGSSVYANEQGKLYPPHTVLKRKMYRRTDMSNVGSEDYDFFCAQVRANWLEFQRCKPEQAGIGLKDFWFDKAQFVVVTLTLSEDLSYGPWDAEENGNCRYQNNCAKNVERMNKDLLAA